MVKPVKKTPTKLSKSEEVVEQQMEEQEQPPQQQPEVVDGKVAIDTGLLKKAKQFNQFASTDRQKDVKKKIKINPGQKKKKLKGIENAINRKEKEETLIEKKSKKLATKKKWKALY